MKVIRLMRRLTIFILCSFFFATTFMTQAQETLELKYGQTVSGELIEEVPELLYTFKGNEGDVIVAEMVAEIDMSRPPGEGLGNFTVPALILRDSEEIILADTRDEYMIFSTGVVAQLRQTGTYTLVATTGNPEVTREGQFSLRLLRVPMLSVGDSVEGEITRGELPDYYAVTQEDTSLFLHYQRLTGRFRPTINIQSMGSGIIEPLSPLVSLSGDSLEQGLVNFPSTAQIYLISVGDSPFPSIDSRAELRYELTVSAEAS